MPKLISCCLWGFPTSRSSRSRSLCRDEDVCQFFSRFLSSFSTSSSIVLMMPSRTKASLFINELEIQSNFRRHSLKKITTTYSQHFRTIRPFHATSNKQFRESSDQPVPQYQKYVTELLGDPWEKDHRIRLFDKDSNELGVVTKGVARRKALEANCVLVCLDSKKKKNAADGIETGSDGSHQASTSEEDLPLYQLITGSMHRDILQAEKKRLKKKERQEREIRIYSKIGTKDLERKISKINNWLQNGCNVRVNILGDGSANQSAAAKEVAKTVQNSVPLDLGKLVQPPDLVSEKKIVKLFFNSLAVLEREGS